MRTNNIKVKFIIPMPYDKPDGNGCIYTKKAIEGAVNNLQTKLPIIFGNKVIGNTTGNTHITTWDNENQVCNLTIDGVVYHGGLECVVETADDKVTSMQIVGFGIAKE